MNCTGKVVGVVRDFTTNKFRITLEVNEPEVVSSQYDNIKDIDLSIKLEKYRRKRSLDANAYFHLLVGKIADIQRISKPRCKNILLGRYGQRETENGKPVVISVLSEIDLMEREDLHTIAIGYGQVGDKEFTHYAVIRGSRTYDTREMSVLIDGTVEEAQALGIETMTPDELLRMKSLWKG